MYLLHSALVHSAATTPKPFHYPHSQMRKLRSREVNQRVLGHTAGVLAQEVGCLQHHLPPTSLLCSEAHHVGAESKTQSWMCVAGAHIGRGKPWMHKGGHMLGGEGIGGTGKKQTPLLSQPTAPGALTPTRSTRDTAEPCSPPGRSGHGCPPPGSWPVTQERTPVPRGHGCKNKKFWSTLQMGGWVEKGSSIPGAVGLSSGSPR